MSKVQIGARVPPRVRMFETRTGSGLYMHAMPPIQGDMQALQAALLSRRDARPMRRGWLARLFRR